MTAGADQDWAVWDLPMAATLNYALGAWAMVRQLSGAFSS